MLLSAEAFAQDLDTTDSAGARRLKVGVVLSGGGAKGVAHIGALRLLEELDIPVDYVVGTSIGSIMGGLYAVGYNSSQLDSLVRSVNWTLIMQDEVNRRQAFFEDKKHDDKLLIKIPFKNRKSFSEEAGSHRGERSSTGSRKGISNILNNLPSAIVEGQNLHSLLTSLTVGYQDDVDFDSLPIPFACVAVDLNTKEEVVFHSGDIVQAIRSSMSIPGYFAPVRIDGKFLVDGGMLNNFPVDVVRSMGADIVIGIDLHKFDKSRTQEVENVGDMVGSMLTVMNGNKYQEGLSNADIVISPNTSSFGVLSFDEESVRALLDIGYYAANQQIDVLTDLAVNQHAAGGHNPNIDPGRKKSLNIMRDSVRISQLSLEGADTDELAYLMRKVKFRPDEYVTSTEIDRLIDNFYLTQAFSKVTYSLAGDMDDDGYNLKVKCVPERVHQAGVGLRFDSEDMASIFISANFNKHKLFGWKFDISGKLGANPYAKANAGYAFTNLWQLNAGYDFKYSNIDFYSKGMRNSSVSQLYHRTEIYMQHKYRNSDLHVGVRGDICRHSSVVTSESDSDDKKYKDRYLYGFASFEFDNRDRSYFAHRGLNFCLEGAYSFAGVLNNDGTDTPDQYTDLGGKFAAYIPMGRRVTLIPQIYARVNLNDTEGYSYYDNMVGGYEPGRYFYTQLPFVGANFVYGVEDIVGVVRADLQVNVYGKHYLTAMANVLADSPDIHSLLSTNNDIYYGFGLKYSIDSFLGPISLIGHWSNLSTKFGMYFSLGYSF